MSPEAACWLSLEPPWDRFKGGGRPAAPAAVVGGRGNNIVTGVVSSPWLEVVEEDVLERCCSSSCGGNGGMDERRLDAKLSASWQPVNGVKGSGVTLSFSTSSIMAGSSATEPLLSELPWCAEVPPSAMLGGGRGRGEVVRRVREVSSRNVEVRRFYGGFAVQRGKW